MPALSTENGKAAPPDIKDVSLRWLAGTVLTGVTSITLMGGALMAAVDGQNEFAVPATINALAPVTKIAKIDAGQAPLTVKSDRPLLVAPAEPDNKILHLSTLTRGEEGNRVRSRPFARLSSSLVRHVDDPRFDIPAFDPVTIFSGASSFRDKGDHAVLYDAQVEDEIEIKNAPFPFASIEKQAQRGFSDEEIEAVIRRDVPVLRASLGDGIVLAHVGAIAYVDPARFEGQKSANSESSFDAFVKIRSENVLILNKTNTVARLANVDSEKVISPNGVRRIADFFQDDMKMSADARPIVAALSEELKTDALSAENTLRMSYAGGPKHEIPDVVSVYHGEEHKITVARADDGHYVVADEPETASDNEIQAAVSPVVDTRETTSLYRGIFETALKNDIPDLLARELIRIYAFDVDFRAPVKASDSMEVFYSLDPDEEKATDESEILYTALVLGDVKRRYYRFKTTDDGEVDYYDEEGRSAKKFLMRQPVPRAKFRSSFGWRVHPILRTARMHNGVDWSAPVGTPIFAAGNGVVEEAKWYAGYGRWVKIKHANGYETSYAHMSRFANGIAPGTRVRQGQIIGYVGSSGLSTGPHLHYEVMVNGNNVDPMRIRLPRGRVLSGEQLATFEIERDRIDQLLQTSGNTSQQSVALNN